MSPETTVVGGAMGDIFWDLPPWIVYAPGYDVGCSIYVANPGEEEREYALMARLSSNATVVSEEALPVFGHTWFKVVPGDLVRLHGAFRFDETDVDLAVFLVERETEQTTDSVSTRLVAPATAALPPTWPATPGVTEGFDWTSTLGMMMPVMMMGTLATVIARPREEKAEVVPSVTEERRLLPPGRE